MLCNCALQYSCQNGLADIASYQSWEWIPIQRNSYNAASFSLQWKIFQDDTFRYGLLILFIWFINYFSSQYAVYFSWAGCDPDVLRTFETIIRLPKMGTLDSFTTLHKQFLMVKTKEWVVTPQIGTILFIYCFIYDRATLRGHIFIKLQMQDCMVLYLVIYTAQHCAV